MTYKLLSATALLLTAFAATADEISPYGKIEDITVSSYGDIRVTMEGPMIDPANCGGSNIRYVMARNHAVYDVIYTMMITAWVSEKEIRFTISSTECIGSNPKLTTARARH